MVVSNRRHRSPSSSRILKAVTLVLVQLFIFPAAFTYYIIHNALKEQSICHVGPTSSSFNGMFPAQDPMLANLYGTYIAFDEASYYFVKTPYNIRPQVLPNYGYWSISTLAFTLFSPKLRQIRENLWKKRSKDIDYNIATAPSIQWDQVHELDIPKMRMDEGHSSMSNRWCLVNQRQDPQKYYKKRPTVKPHGKVISGKDVGHLFYDSNGRIRSDKKSEEFDGGKPFKLCSPPETSIMSAGNTLPYFVELPLHPPDGGVWEVPASEGIKRGMDLLTAYDQRSQNNAVDYKIEVRCNVKDVLLQDLARGVIKPDSTPQLGWENAANIESFQRNPFYLPGTSLVLIALLLVQLRPRSRRKTSNTLAVEKEDWNFVRAMQLLWFHSSWINFSITAIWVYLIGSCLEPVLGTIPYLAITVLLLQIVAFSGENMWSNSFLFLCFGQAVLLAQLEPSLTMGAVEISAVSFGDSASSLKLNVFCLAIPLFPFVQYKKINWRTIASCLVLGWVLSQVTALELLAAPQWTIPTLLMTHLWLELSKIPDDLIKKKDIEDVESLIDDTDTLTHASVSSSVAYRSRRRSWKERMFRFFHVNWVYMCIGIWMILTIGCVFTLDWTLAIGNLITLWLCIGTVQFPLHPLWSLYHMVASYVIIMMNVATLVGWILCHVTIAAQALRSLPPRFVYASLIMQTSAHTFALFYTARTKHWCESRNTPGYYFWKHVKMLGDQIVEL
mmetsp:Transcript_8949/g.13762  ORF Transcript_8949/g.13762 Transcript_8949/m.13762 type:complete len:727 (+) Transcript_8949:117-2297(+)